ncbi:hypothetical protein GGQ84_001500 [Desulfitispora alkaliphila]|uniref:polysaccharide deacetylase family protein n=1 Tax=Desulfitispora alkaliphila TaxID=622674 RepID=UPI003D19A08F
MKKLNRNLSLLLVLMSFMVFAGCGAVEEEKTKENGLNDGEQVEQVEVIEEEEAIEKSLTEEEMQELGVNELGQVMVLMYHVIGDEEGTWARTRDNFRNDLQRLYDSGYRTVSMTDFLTGNISVPAGTTPIIFTFDDGTPGHFTFIEEDGELIVDPDSAVGIMLDFSAENPDFGHNATFYLNFNPPPFGQREHWEEKLRFLDEKGMEIGNHSYSHEYLNRVDDEEVQRQLGKVVKIVTEVLPGYEINSLALPFGLSAENSELEMQGSYKGIEYNHLGVLRVGANPSNPLGHENFNPARIPRVRACEDELNKWLNHFEQNPHLRYVSDGDSNTIAIPVHMKEHIDEENLDHGELVVYEGN